MFHKASRRSDNTQQSKAEIASFGKRPDPEVESPKRRRILTTRWKREIREGTIVKDVQKKRGPVPSKNHELEALQKENERLKKELLQARQIIELQKKVAALFGETEEIPAQNSQK